MEFQVKVGVSNRHVHLTREVYDMLFDEEPMKIADLHQTGEFVTNQVVRVEGKQGMIENVKVLGPFRTYNQVEISSSDAYKLGVCPPVRRSGDLEDSETVVLSTKKGKVTLKNSCILAQCHIHMNKEDLDTYHVKDKQVVDVIIEGKRPGIMKAHIKVSDHGVLEFHVDRDEASAFCLENGQSLRVIL